MLRLRRTFTLLVVVWPATTGCLADLDKRLISNEVATIRQMQVLHATLECYRQRVGQYPARLAELEAYVGAGCETTDTLRPMLLSVVTKSSASGYGYSYRPLEPGPGFEISAFPLELGKTGRRSFWINERGDLRERVGGSAGPSDPKVQ
jgi:hypothetical protein